MPVRTVEVAFLGTTAQLEAALTRAGLVAEVEGKHIGEAFTSGTTKAGGALTKLGALGGSWGVPFSKSLTNIGKQLDDATSKSRKLSTALAATGKLTVGAGLLGFAAAAYEGVKGATALQRQMEMLHTQAGVAQSRISALTTSVENMAGSVGTGPQTLAAGIYHVASSLDSTLPAISRNATELKVLRTAAEGAKVGNANLVDVTNALDAAVVSGIAGVQNYSQAMGALNATVGAGDMTMQDLADALGTGLLSVMKTFGLSIQDTGGALAVFGDNNIRGAEAATKLGSAIRIMAAPSSAGASALKSIGIGSLELANDMRNGGLIPALTDLKQHLQASGDTASQQAQILTNAFGRRQSTGVLLLIGQLDRLKSKTADVGCGAKNFSGDWVATTKTLAFQFDALKAEAEELADKFGTILIPDLEHLGAALNDGVGYLEKHKTACEVLAGVITGVLGAAVLTFAGQTALKFTKSIGTMLDGIDSLASGVGAGVSKIVAHFGEQNAAATASAAKIGESTAAASASVETEAAKVAASTGAIDDSFAGTGAAAGTAAAATGAAAAKASGAVGGEAAAVTAADTTIEAENTAAGASFSRLLGPIALALAAVYHFRDSLASTSSKTSKPDMTRPQWVKWLETEGGMGAKQANAFLKANASKIVFDQPGISNSKLTGSNVNAATGAVSGSMTLTGSGGLKLSKNQLAFASALSGETGLDPGVVEAWLASEQGSEKANPASDGLYNFLNIGITGSGKYGAGDKQWQNPATAGLATAKWLQGISGAVPGYETASPQIQAILQTAGQAVQKQIAAIQYNGQGGWSTGGEPALPGAYQDVINGGGPSGKGLYATGSKGSYGPSNSSNADSNRPSKGTLIPHGGTSVDHAKYRFIPDPGTNWNVGQEPAIAKALNKLANELHENIYGISGYRTSAQSVAAGGFANDPHTQGKAGDIGVGNQLRQSAAQLTAAELAKVGLYRPFYPASAKEINHVQLIGGAVPSATGTGTGDQQFTGALNNLGTRGGGSLPKLVTALNTLERSVGRGLTVTQTVTDSLNLNSKALNAAEHPLTKLVTDTLDLNSKSLAAGETPIAAVAKSDTTDLLATQMKDQTQLMSDADAAQLSIVKDSYQIVSDQMTAAATAVKDQTQSIADSFQSIAASIDDATQAMTDTSGALVQGINDQTQTKVDLLGERGLYGLNLLAQQQQVQLDQMKTGFDAQIAAAQANVDATKGTWDATTSQDQLILDQVQTQQDQLVAMAQQNVDTVTLGQDTKVAAALAHVDSVTLGQDIAVQLAQTASDLSAGGSKAEQTATANALKNATSASTLAVNNAQNSYAAAQDAANSIINRATQGLTTAQNQATSVIGYAQQTLTTATGQAQAQLALANQALAGITDTANVAEARQQGLVQTTQAQASTQYAGSGIEINMYGLNPSDASANASALGWELRTVIPA